MSEGRSLIERQGERRVAPPVDEEVAERGAMTCALCGHEMNLDRCGSAGATLPDGTPISLCHADDHDCYHRWTVYKERRPAPPVSASLDPAREILARLVELRFTGDGDDTEWQQRWDGAWADSAKLLGGER